jgi:hypothetical protein
VNQTFSRALRCSAALPFLLALAGCGGSTPIAGAGDASVSTSGTGGNTMTARVGDAGSADAAGGAAGRGGMNTACVAGAACSRGFTCDQTCRMGGQAGLIACSCNANNVVGCGMCVPGAVPACLPTVINGQTCVPAMNPDCGTPCANGVRALCTCVPGMAGRGGGGAMSGTWRCAQSPNVCM